MGKGSAHGSARKPAQIDENGRKTGWSRSHFCKEPENFGGASVLMDDARWAFRREHAADRGVEHALLDVKRAGHRGAAWNLDGNHNATIDGFDDPTETTKRYVTGIG